MRRRRKEVPLKTLEQALAGRGDDRPFSEALTLPGVSVIAEHKRRSPSAGTIRDGRDRRRRRRRLRARRRRGAVDPHRGPALRRLARRPARGARRVVAADPAQGLHRRRLPGLRVGGRRRRRDPADRRRAGPRASSPSSTPRRRRWTSTCSSRCTPRPSSTARWRSSTPTSSASTTATCRTSASTSQRTFELLHDIPAGKTVVSESGFHSREQLDELERVGVDGVLVGESLMRAPDPEAALRALSGADADEHWRASRRRRDAAPRRARHTEGHAHAADPLPRRPARRHRRRRPRCCSPASATATAPTTIVEQAPPSALQPAAAAG